MKRSVQNKKIDNKIEEETVEDDYMSDVILNQIEDKRPGLVFSRVTARKFEIEKKHEEKNEATKKKQIPIRLLEDKTREEALKKSVLEEGNKGFNLMLKMGYKAGQSLGRQTDQSNNIEKKSIIEPISVQLKSDRTGLGENEEKKRKLEQIEKMRYGMAKYRKELEQQATEVYLDKKRSVFQIKKLRNSLYKCQKICFQLDSVKLNLKEPQITWFWPRNTLKPSNKETESQLKIDEPLEEDTFVKPELVEEEKPCFIYKDKAPIDLNKIYNQRLENFINQDEEEEKPKIKKGNNNYIEEEFDESEDDEEELTPGYSIEFCDKVKKEKKFESDSENETEQEDNEETLNQKINSICLYLREKYFYCVWCVVSYESQADLEQNCPGVDENSHDT